MITCLEYAVIMPMIEGAQRPFWMHQVVEYLIGLVLIGGALQTLEPVVPATMGVVVMANSAIAKGPASAFPITSRRHHRWLDVVVMVLLVVAAFQPVVDVDSTGRLLLGAIAFVMFFIWLNSDFAEKPARKSRRAASARPESEEIGRKAGRAVGGAVGGGITMANRWRRSKAEAAAENDEVTP